MTKQDRDREDNTAFGRMDSVVGLRLHPCCSHHARTWEETQRGLLPPSEHSPGCTHYKRERFAALDWEGAVCFTECGEHDECLGDPDERPTISEIWMTRDQFERLREFQGP